MSSEIIQPDASEMMPIYDSALSDRRPWAKLLEIVAYRYLLRNLVARDIKVRYKNSALGILWSMLNPLGLMIVFTVLFTVLSRINAQRQFPVFILVGLMPWNFFSGAVSSGTVSVISQWQLIKKVYFPRELLPTAALLSNFVNFLITFAVLVVFLYAFGIGLTIHALWVPALLLCQLIFMLGLIMFLSAAAVFYRDVMMVMEVLMLAWFFLTPVFYPLEQFGDSATVMGITFVPAQVMRWVNPMASIIDGYRTVLWGTVNSSGPVGMDIAFLLRTFATAVIVFVVGYSVFARTEHLFGEKL
jgi:ABC-type polysaccharide/polyol phosphate export permease